MDLRTGRTYDSKEDAIAAGVPESDLASIQARFDDMQERIDAPPVVTGRRNILAALKECPEVSFSTGPFKGRAYKRVNGQLVRSR